MQEKIINKHYGSTFQNEQELLYAIIKIHNESNSFDCDPMYNQGMFYKKLIDKPKYRFDINASEKGYDAEQGDATNIPLANNSIKSIILDPPFMFGTHGQTKNNVINKRYTMFDTFDELYTCYENILKEAFRVLKNNGILVFKCQDYTDSSTTMTHCIVYLLATKLGFYAKDMAILVKENKIYNPNLTQRHFRKTHSYFWVFQKKNALVSNSSPDKSGSFNKGYEVNQK